MIFSRVHISTFTLIGAALSKEYLGVSSISSTTVDASGEIVVGATASMTEENTEENAPEAMIYNGTSIDESIAREEEQADLANDNEEDDDDEEDEEEEEGEMDEEDEDGDNDEEEEGDNDEEEEGDTDREDDDDDDADDGGDTELGAHLKRRYEYDASNEEPILYGQKWHLQKYDQETIRPYLRKLINERVKGVCSMSDWMCQVWIERGECEVRPELAKFSKPLFASCNAVMIGDAGSSFGEEQNLELDFEDSSHSQYDMHMFLQETELYVDLVLADESYPGYNKYECLNFHPECSVWALAGECEQENWAMMLSECAPACRSCGLLDESS